MNFYLNHLNTILKYSRHQLKEIIIISSTYFLFTLLFNRIQYIHHAINFLSLTYFNATFPLIISSGKQVRNFKESH